MKLANYRDISPPPGDVRAGFQWEFVCDCCGETWKSPFKPYRVGQAAGILRRIGFVFGEFYKVGAVTDMLGKVTRASGSSVESSGKGAKEEALQEAIALAQDRHHRCGNCKSTVCDNCWDEARDLCTKCDKIAGLDGGASSQSSAGASTTACPNCQTPSQGGRFCHECGFDMASTHKSCPSCSATMPRQARFCTDCGHGF